MMRVHNWADALAIANGYSAMTGRRWRVKRKGLIWTASEVGDPRSEGPYVPDGSMNRRYQRLTETPAGPPL